MQRLAAETLRARAEARAACDHADSWMPSARKRSFVPLVALALVAATGVSAATIALRKTRTALPLASGATVESPMAAERTPRSTDAPPLTPPSAAPSHRYRRRCPLGLPSVRPLRRPARVRRAPLLDPRNHLWISAATPRTLSIPRVARSSNANVFEELSGNRNPATRSGAAGGGATAEGGDHEKRRFFGEGGREPSRDDKGKIWPKSIFGQILSWMRIARIALAALMLAQPAQAQEERRASNCADEAERGQRHRDEGKLLSARESFVLCSQRGCPSVVQRECANWLDAITVRIPTIVPSARDEVGNDLTSVRIRIDGGVVASEITGAAIAVDPGRHEVRFERANGAHVDVSIVAREGEHGRIVSAAFAVATPPTASTSLRERPPPHPRGLPVAAYATGAVGVASLGIAAYAGIRGLVAYNHLSDSCAPNCAPDEVASVRSTLLVATIAGAVSVAAWTSTLLLLVWPRSKTSTAIAPLIPFAGAPFGVSGRFVFD